MGYEVRLRDHTVNAVAAGLMGGGVLGFMEWETARDVLIALAAIITALTIILKSPPMRFLGQRLLLDPFKEGVKEVVLDIVKPLQEGLTLNSERLVLLEAATDAIVHEIRPNSGESMKDKLNEVHGMMNARLDDDTFDGAERRNRRARDARALRIEDRKPHGDQPV